MIQTLLDEGSRVVVGIRNILPPTDKDPFSYAARVEMLKRAFPEEVKKGLVRWVEIPEDVDGGMEVIYGRKVGWSMRELRLDSKTEEISGTKTREALRKENKL